MSRRKHRLLSAFDLYSSTTPTLEGKPQFPDHSSFLSRHHLKKPETSRQHDRSWDLSVRDSFRRNIQKEINNAPSAVPKETAPVDKKNGVSTSAPSAIPASKAPVSVAPTSAPSPRPSTFFAQPATPAPIPLSPIISPSQRPVKWSTPTTAPARPIAPVPAVVPPLSPPFQEASDALSSPNTSMPSVSSHGPVTLMAVLGAALASLLLSVLVLRARHRYVLKHGAASARRRLLQRESETKPESAVPTGIEIQDTVESREVIDADDDSL